MQQGLQPSRSVFYRRRSERPQINFDALPAEAKIAGLMDLIANPILAATDRTQQLRRLALIVRDEALEDEQVLAWGEAMWPGGGRHLRQMVADARAGRPLAL